MQPLNGNGLEEACQLDVIEKFLLSSRQRVVVAMPVTSPPIGRKRFARDENDECEDDDINIRQMDGCDQNNNSSSSSKTSKKISHTSKKIKTSHNNVQKQKTKQLSLSKFLLEKRKVPPPPRERSEVTDAHDSLNHQMVASSMSVDEFFNLQDLVTSGNSDHHKSNQSEIVAAAKAATSLPPSPFTTPTSAQSGESRVGNWTEGSDDQKTQESSILNSSSQTNHITPEHMIRVICDNSQVGGVELWRRMEHGPTTFSFDFCERSLPEPLLMIIDASTCVCLIVEQDLVNEDMCENRNDDETSNENNSRFGAMCDQLIRLSMSFQTCWVIFDVKSRSNGGSGGGNGIGDKMPGSLASNDIQTFIKLQKWFVQMQASLDCSMKLRYTCSTEPCGLDNFAMLLNEFVETTAAIKRKQSEKHFEKWLDRDFLGEIESS